MRVVIIGGGLGGLALGSGLRRSGIEVTVVERDSDLAATGGYHITLQRPVQDALAELLPPDVFEQVLASAADGRLRDPDVLWDPRGRMIGRAKLKSDDPGIDIDRITLRLLLAEAVGPDLIIGRSFVRFERATDGTVLSHLDDGSTLRADVLVGADGVHSTIARELAGGATNRPTGITGISGRTALSELTPADRARLGIRSSLGIGPHGTALYFGYLDPAAHAVLEAPELRRSVTTEPTFIWGAMLPDSDHTRALSRFSGADIRDRVTRMLARRGWTGTMTEVISRTDPESVGVFRFHAAPQTAREQAPWAASNVTALGDAVHATPPTAGMGAGAAIRDAARLAQELGRVDRGEKALAVGVRDFETDMRERGADVVRAAMTTVRQILVTATPVGAIATRLALPLLAAVQGVRRRAVARIGAPGSAARAVS